MQYRTRERYDGTTNDPEAYFFGRDGAARNTAVARGLAVLIILGLLSAVLCITNCILCTDYAHPISQIQIIEGEGDDDCVIVKRPSLGTVTVRDDVDELAANGESDDDHAIVKRPSLGTVRDDMAALAALRVSRDTALKMTRRPCCCGCYRRHDHCIPSTISARSRQRIFFANIFFVIFLVACVVLLMTAEVSLNRAVDRLPRLLTNLATYLSPTLTNDVNSLTVALVIALDRVGVALSAANACHVSAVLSSSEFATVTAELEAVNGDIYRSLNQIDTTSLSASIQSAVSSATASLNTTSVQVVRALNKTASSVIATRDDLDRSAHQTQRILRVAAWSVFGAYLVLGFAGVGISWADGMYASLRARCVQKSTPLSVNLVACHSTFSQRPRFAWHSLMAVS
jgi:hypothetical protein